MPWLAEYIDKSVEEVLAISFTVFRLHFVLAATRALDQLAEPAALCASSVFGFHVVQLVQKFVPLQALQNCVFFLFRFFIVDAS